MTEAVLRNSLPSAPVAVNSASVKMPVGADDVRIRGRIQHDVAELFLRVGGVEVPALHELLDDLSRA